ncbi:unnamed protein product [Clonostachys rosea]|uniref:Uncharacterized protein n=1 Tax=Bionectria ochroleuca TaxID=29856 RepID=A0ABY6TSF0_BIOOC|nr:unnamed protein product [Clonostachys rosea]
MAFPYDFWPAICCEFKPDGVILARVAQGRREGVSVIKGDVQIPVLRIPALCGPRRVTDCVTFSQLVDIGVVAQV